jgi:hypothetical protein
VYQVATGITSDLFVGSVIAMAIAGILSYIALRATPKPVPKPESAVTAAGPQPAATETSPIAGTATAPSDRSIGRFGPGRAVLIGLVGVAVIAGAAVFAGAVRLPGLGGGDTGASPTASARTLSGTFVLTNGEPVGSDGGCSGTGGYSDIRPGIDVVVSDGSGSIIATTDLSVGTPIDDVTCSFTFRLEDVPPTTFYTVEVGDRGQITYSAADLAAENWNITLELGGAS